MSDPLDGLIGRGARRPQSSGLSAVDLVDLPPAQRSVMRLLLRERAMGAAALRVALAALPAADRPLAAQLDDTLAQLCAQNWLIREGEGDGATYKANFQRKAGPARTGRVWDALNFD